MSISLKQNGWSPSGLAWAEYNPRAGPSSSNGSMSYQGGNQQVMRILVYWRDIMQWVADLCGTNIFNTSTGNLDRVLPMKHPVWDWLYCSAVTAFEGWVPTDKAVHPATFSGVVSTQYDFAILTLLFQQPHYTMLNDADTDHLQATPAGQRPEHERFLQGWPRPKAEFIVAEAQTAVFLETTQGGLQAKDSRTGNLLATAGPAIAGNAQTGTINSGTLAITGLGSTSGFTTGMGVSGDGIPQNTYIFSVDSATQVTMTQVATKTQSTTITFAGVSFPSPWPVSLPKADEVRIWKRVPLAGLFSKGGRGSAVNLDAALQTVNQYTILNRPPGTLKFIGYQLIDIESPLPPEFQQGSGAQEGIANLCFDVVLSWDYFDPPYDLNAANGTPTRGHNLGPWRGTPAGSGSFNSLWYKIGALGGDPLLFPVSDHFNIFRLSA